LRIKLFGALFQFAVLMSDDSCPFPPTLEGYAEQDPELRVAHAHFQQVFAKIKRPGGVWGSDEFSFALGQLCAFVADTNCVGRALLCGVICRGELLAIIGDALPAILQYKDRRPVIRQLSRIGWIPTTHANIGYDQIQAAFGPLLLPAGHFHQTITYFIDSKAIQPPAGPEGSDDPPPHHPIEDVAAEILSRTEGPEVESDPEMMPYLIEVTAEDPDDDDLEDPDDDPEVPDDPAEVADGFFRSVLAPINPLAEENARLARANDALIQKNTKLAEANARLRAAFDRQKKKLSDKTKAYKKQTLTLARTCRALHQHNEALTTLKEQYDTLYTEYKTGCLPALCEGIVHKSDLEGHPFIAEMLRLARINPRGRIYSPQMYDFAYGLHAISPKAYTYTRGVLPLPAISSVVEHFHAETVSITSCLKSQDEKSISEYLQKYREQERWAPDEWVPANLAFDATPVNSKGIGFNPETGSCFTFILLPLDHGHKDTPIHSERHKDGHIDEHIRAVRDTLLRIMKQNHFMAHFVGTDGDNGVDGAHSEAFESYKNSSGDLAEIVAGLTNNGEKDLEDWPISDLFHLMKNARSRETTGTLAVSPVTQDVVTGETLAKGLPTEEKHLFETHRPLDLLKDDLALQAFSLDNLLWIWSGHDPDNLPNKFGDWKGKYGDPNGGFFMAPFIALSLAVRNESLGMDARLVLLQVAFSFFFGMMQHYPPTGAQQGITENKVKECPRQTLWARSMCRRACNLCVGLYWAIQKFTGPEYRAMGFELALNRIGTHPVECHFGMTRSTLNGDPRWERFFSAQVKAVLIRRVMYRLKIPAYIRRFTQPAGCLVRQDDQYSVSLKFPFGFGRVHDAVLQLLGYLWLNQPHQAHRVGYELLAMFSQLRKDLLKVGALPNIRQSGPTSGGCIETRWYAQRRCARGDQPKVREPQTQEEFESIRVIEELAEE
jgi:hypothetical protein